MFRVHHTDLERLRGAGGREWARQEIDERLSTAARFEQIAAERRLA